MDKKYYIIIIVILLIFNYIIGPNTASWDLTEDKRYSLGEVTENLVENVEEPILVEVLFEGDFPAGYKRLQESIKDILSGFKSLNSKIRYVSEDPLDVPQDQLEERQQLLAKQGLVPFPISVGDGSEFVAKTAFPYAIFSKNDAPPVIIQLLEGAPDGNNDEAVINNSISQLEYKFSNAIQKLSSSERRRIGILTSNGTKVGPSFYHMSSELSRYYALDAVNLDSTDLISPDYPLLIIQDPSESFTTDNLFAIDQYVMNGGNVLWFINTVNVNLDSIRANGEHICIARDINVDNLLFKYGMRLNSDLVLDLECSSIPQVSSVVNGKPKYENRPWVYHALGQVQGNSPITYGVDRVDLDFPSSIDTVKVDGDLKRSVILSSSAYSKNQNVPLTITTDITRANPDPALFNEGPFILGLLSEGQFPSFFRNRVSSVQQEILRKAGTTYKELSQTSKQVVVTDADFVKTNYTARNGEPLPLGANKWERKVYQGNYNLLVNTIEYMMGNGPLLKSKSKNIKVRMLNTVKAKDEKGKWQLLNLGLPLVFLLFIGMVYNFIRKKRYG